MAFKTSLSPIGDHFCRPPAVWPSMNISEMADAIRRKSVVVIPFKPSMRRPGTT
jgi:hypothetical protein